MALVLKLVLAVVLVAMALTAYFFIRNSRMATETPDYRVLEKEGAFELRAYPQLLLASTPMDTQEKGMNGGFGRLFRFITGENRTGQKISMTTPVLLEGGTTQKGVMSFVVPRSVSDAGAPEPKSDAVYLKKLEAGRFAVLRFKGQRDARNEQDAMERLRVWMLGKAWVGSGEPFFAYYDPPWTPVWFRRNEVLWRLQD